MGPEPVLVPTACGTRLWWRAARATQSESKQEAVTSSPFAELWRGSPDREEGAALL